nr:unnamed protein product [Spirometra erinaceieuropaei]
MSECLDTIDPANFIIGIIHLPPGRTAQSLLPTTEPVLKVLQKFFRKFEKHPGEALCKEIPSSNEDEDVLLVAEGATDHVGGGSQPRLPFVGRSSGGGYCLRQLPAHRLHIRVSKRTTLLSRPAENHFAVANNEMDAGEKSEGKSSRKRSRMAAEDLDADVMCPLSPAPKKPKRRRSEQ